MSEQGEKSRARCFAQFILSGESEIPPLRSALGRNDSVVRVALMLRMTAW